MAAAHPSPPDPIHVAVAPRRLEILRLIWRNELPVSDIAAELPVSVPAVSQHLAKLKDAGLVAVRADGRRRYYRAAHGSMGGLAELLRPLLEDTAGDLAPPDRPVGSPQDAARGGPSPDAGTSPRAPESPLRPSTPSAASAAARPLLPSGDEMVSWYRQGLRARVVALKAARSALGDGAHGAADSIRRLAGSLVRSTIADRFPAVARAAGALAVAPDRMRLLAGTERLIGVLSQEIARDDPMVARILVVEDSRVEAALTRSIVSGPNREILWATSAEEAQRIVDEERVDLVLLDLGLPGEDGRDLLARLGRRPLTASIPVILLTGRTDVQTRTEVMSLGADAFFTKPADGPVLASAVAMMLERSAEARQAGRQDPLTGLANRTVFLAELRNLAASAARMGIELALALVDTDHLATINDIHGSEVGDRVLRTVGDALRSSVRDSDTVARWDGGTFAVLFSDLEARGVVEALDDLRRITDRTPLALDDGSDLVATWHAGVAPISGPTAVDDAVARATRRLELARKHGTRVMASDEATRGPRHVVLVEDDEILADLIRHRLGREGLEVSHYADGSEALGALPGLTASAVILDVMLPGADGFEILRRLRRAPSLAGVPVMVLTFGGDHDAQRAFELGANDALAKPFSVRELVTRVSRLVDELEGREGHG